MAVEERAPIESRFCAECAWGRHARPIAPPRAIAERLTPCPDRPMPQADPTWDDIYRRLARDRNDAAALAALERRVTRWAERQLRSPDALYSLREDVVAETCAGVVLKLDRTYSVDTFPGFVYGFYLNARRRALAAVRHAEVPLENVELTTSDEAGPPADELALLERCLAELPERERRAITLRYFADASSQEIAARLGVSEGNARRIVFNGLAHLRRSATRAWPTGRG